QGYSRKAAALQFLGRLDEAERCYEQGLEKEPDSAQLRQGLRDLRARMAAERRVPNPLGAPDLLERLRADPRTRALLEQPEYRELLDELRRRPAELGASVTPAGHWGHEMGGGPGGWGEYEVGEGCHLGGPGKVTVTLPCPQALREKELGNAAYRRRSFDTALGHYGRARELDPRDMTYIANQAAVHFEKGEYERCRELCEEAVAVGRENREDYRQIAK
ncbi:STIP1 protein, partial [Crypturellus soui]|nr:STIP1 protein [Crypturellus soui]